MMKIRPLNKRKLKGAMPLVWRVFSEYEAEHDSEAGQKAFWEAIHSEEYLDSLTAFGAYERKELVGIIATRKAGTHLALFFVDGSRHGEGIGRRLWTAVLAENRSPIITVHSSLYAVEIYRKLGFTVTADVQTEGGIRYVPMEYRSVVVAHYPCPKKTCIRHGQCNECRAHHAGRKRPCPCEKVGQ
ncbi:MAG: GNAT family N-acetyltransferase [Christensenellaceae bacterium]